MQMQYGLKTFDFLPKTFVLPRQQEQLREYHEQEPYSTWIVKPCGASCGKGIYLTRDPYAIETEAGEPMVVSRYLDNPLLIDGYKFDLRIYVAVTSFDPLRIYIYEEGLCRFATEKYDVSGENLTSNFVHLTNYSVNKHNEKFQSNDDAEQDDEGHKWSLSAFRQHLKDCNVDDELLWERIHDICVKSIISVEPIVRSSSAMYQQGKNNCFEMFGFDILVEENMRPWLLEVNLSPSLSICSPLDRKVKCDAVTDLLNVVGIDGRPAKPDSRGKQGSYNKRVHPSDKKKKKARKERAEAPGGFQAPGAGGGGAAGGGGGSFLDDSRFQAMVGENGLSSEERRVLKLSQEEMERAKPTGWQCLFPTRHSIMYASFFDGARPHNALLAKLMWWATGVEPHSAHAKAVARQAMVPFWKEEQGGGSGMQQLLSNSIKRGGGNCATPPKRRGVAGGDRTNETPSKPGRTPKSKAGIGLFSTWGQAAVKEQFLTLMGKAGSFGSPGLPGRSQMKKLIRDKEKADAAAEAQQEGEAQREGEAGGEEGSEEYDDEYEDDDGFESEGEARAMEPGGGGVCA